MELISQFSHHLTQDQVISYSSTNDHDITIRASIAIVTNKFVEYQKDLITEFIADLSHESSKEWTSFRTFKWYVEFALQELNSKLAVFAEKVSDTPSFDIRGVVEVCYKEEYLASLIGDVSFMILRQWKIYYSLFNETSKRVKISLFADFVEGDLQHQDQIIVIGSDISDIVDEHDLADITDITASSGQSFIDLLIQTINQRAWSGITTFESHTSVKWEPSAISSIPQQTHKLKSKFNNRFVLHQYQVWMVIFGCIIAWLVYSIVNNYNLQHGSQTIVNDAGEQVDITLESIKKDIAMFQRLDATSPTKISTYNDIKNKIDLLDQTGRAPLDIQELRKILEEEYYKWFRINTVSQFDSPILSFTDSDLSSFGSILGIYVGKDGFHVGWTRAALIWSVNNQLKGTLVRYGDSIATDSLQWCNSSLGRVWLYCYDNQGQVFLIGKSGIETVQNSSTANIFPWPIAGVGTFASNNFYILTQNQALNDAWTYILRYQSVGNNPSSFREPQNYPVSGSGQMNLQWMAIDGTFLMWNWSTRQIVQFRRDGTTPQTRIVPLKWWDNIDWAYSQTGISIISYNTSRYVYLWDAPQQSLTVFNSTPPKTNDNNSTNFTLEYVMRLKFDPSLWVKWVIISDAAKPQLWAVTNQWVFLYNISQDIEQYTTTTN